MGSTRRVAWVIATAVSGVSISPPPEFMAAVAIPVDRVIGNLTRASRRNPEDPQLIYNLARSHYLALANRSSLVPTYGVETGELRPAPGHIAQYFVQRLLWEEATRRTEEALKIEDQSLDREARRHFNEERRKAIEDLESEGWRPDVPSMDDMHRHAEQAMLHFERAIELSPDNSLFHLGRASLGEECLELELQGKLPRRRVIESLQALSLDVVRDQYYATFKLAFARDVERDSVPIEGLTGLVSHEAAQAYLRLVTEMTGLAEGQEDRIAEVRDGFARIKKLPMTTVTPILIGTQPDESPSRIVRSAGTAVFDLDGDGAREEWPWVRPDVGILVWDPFDEARIESGRQLFGSVSFFLFHRNGYEALRLLDDNQDGRLSGSELDGLAVWCDENGDGISQRHEVRPAWEVDIVEIDTVFAVDADGLLHNRGGVRYGDGSTAPTADWVVSPIRKPMATRSQLRNLSALKGRLQIEVLR